MKNPLTVDNLKESLDSIYKCGLTGLPGTKSCYVLANEFTSKYSNESKDGKKSKALTRFITNQLSKATTTGFITGLGGLIVLPVAIPADLVSIMYIQLQTILTIAVIGGYEPKDEEVKTLVYACILNYSVSELFKQAGIKAGNKFTIKMIEKIPSEVIKKINQKAMQRLVTKAGETGIINLTKLAPVIGGFVGGGVDYYTTRVIANRAYKMFILNEID